MNVYFESMKINNKNYNEFLNKNTQKQGEEEEIINIFVMIQIII
jgi:hypothetical protein